MNKREELKKRIIDENPDIILLTEIYPKYEHTISAILEYKVDGYTLDSQFFPEGWLFTLKIQ